MFGWQYPVYVSVLTYLVLVLFVVAVILVIYYVLLKFRLRTKRNFWSKQHFVSTDNVMYLFKKSDVNDEIRDVYEISNDNMLDRGEQLKTFNLHFAGLEKGEYETQSCSGSFSGGMGVSSVKIKCVEDEMGIISNEMVTLSSNHNAVPAEVNDITKRGVLENCVTSKEDEIGKMTFNGCDMYNNVVKTDEKDTCGQNSKDVTIHPIEIHAEDEVVYAEVKKKRRPQL